jgi:hypothetical protein
VIDWEQHLKRPPNCTIIDAIDMQAFSDMLHRILEPS